MYDKLDEDNEVSKLSQEQNISLAKRISDDFRDSTNEIMEQIKSSKEAWSYYIKNTPDQENFREDQVKDTATANDKSKKGLRWGVIYKIAISVMAYISNIIFPQDERFFRGTPQNALSIEWQEFYEQNLADRFAEANILEEYKKFILSAIFDPTAAALVKWESKRGRKVSYVSKYSISVAGIDIPIPVFGGMKKSVEEDAVLWEGTLFKPLDFNDWRIDPYARTLDETWFTHRWYEPIHKIEREYGLKDVKSYQDAWSTENWDDKYILNGLSTPTRPIKTESEVEGKSQALLMCCYDDFIIKGKLYENYIALVLNGQEVIWFGPNKNNHGKKPVVLYSFNPIPNQMYGVSLVHHALPSAAVIDTAASQILKIGEWAAKPVFEADLSEPVFKKSRLIKPGVVYPVRRVGQAIRQVPINVANLAILQQLMEQADTNIKEVTGTSQMMLGEGFDQPANITAFQVDQTLQGTGSLFQSFIRNLCNMVIEPYLQMTFENDRQYRTQDVFVDENKTLTTDILKQLDYKFVTTSTQAVQSRGKRLANLQMLLTQLIPGMVQNGVAQLAPNQLIFDIPAITKELMVLGGESTSDRYMQTIEGPTQDGLGAMGGAIPPTAGIGPGGPIPPPAV